MIRLFVLRIYYDQKINNFTTDIRVRAICFQKNIVNFLYNNKKIKIKGIRKIPCSIFTKLQKCAYQIKNVRGFCDYKSWKFPEIHE